MYVVTAAEICIKIDIMIRSLVGAELSVIRLQLLTLLLLLFYENSYCNVMIDSQSLVNAPCSCF
jgi:hypothetical protein